MALRQANRAPLAVQLFFSVTSGRCAGRNWLEFRYPIATMNVIAPPADVVRSTISKAEPWALLFALTFYALLWLEVIRQLAPEWSLNPQYGYGWVVPLLMVYLLWQRWSARPTPIAPRNHALPTAIIVFIALGLFPLRVVAEANPDWRLVGWTLALGAMVASFSLTFLNGGRPWFQHFAFPLCFFLVAVPWPMHFEQVVIQGLMRTVSAVNVAFLNIIGVPALQHGNVIEIGNGFVGIEEACSGVRSFQATLMVSLFLGEFYVFNVAGRVLLIVSGALLAFVCNLARTAVLGWLTALRGTSSLQAWHDPAGITILLICLGGLWLLSLLLRERAAAPNTASPRTIGPPEDGLALPSNHVSALRSLGPLFAGLAAWIVLSEVGVQLWSRAHALPVTNTRWHVQWPTEESTFRVVPMPPETKTLLHYDQGSAGMWKTEGRPWMLYFFRWSPGQTAGLSIKIHRPEICLPATGMTLTSDDGGRLLAINGVDLYAHSYRFNDRGESLHVLYCYGDVRSPEGRAFSAEQEDWTARGRLRAAFKGRPEIGTVLELAVWGYRDDAEAYDAMQRELRKLVRAD
jgi:exosortase